MSSVKREPSPPRFSLHASSLPQGIQLSSPPLGSALIISHAPGFDLPTASVPVDGTNGVTIDAAATAEPDRSYISTSHPFLSFFSLLDSRP
jgi:hypothetical protein